MFSLNELKQTRFYQEAFEEGKQQGLEESKQEGIHWQKLRTLPLLLRLGLSVEQVAQELELAVEEVQQVAQQQSSS
jgi:predicted transposase/invertase (TIGR01784 family)